MVCIYGTKTQNDSGFSYTEMLGGLATRKCVSLIEDCLWKW
jgi:hypothetical protein